MLDNQCEEIQYAIDYIYTHIYIIDIYLRVAIYFKLSTPHK